MIESTAASRQGPRGAFRLRLPRLLVSVPALVLLPILVLAPVAWAQAPDGPTAEDLAVELERLLTALEIAADALPRDTFDPQVIVDEVGTDPEALFAWVRDNTYLVPYKGALRGPIGVLQDRMGNSLDRALLLRELLRLAGHDALLARGTLTPERAGELWGLAGRPPLADEPPEAGDDDLPTAEMIADQAGLDYARLEAVIAENDRISAELEGVADERIDWQSDFLLTAAGDLRADAASASAELLLEHWWVEIQMPTSIVDLDPSLPTAQVGETLTEPEIRFSPASINELRALPDTAHTLVVRVVVERWEEGALLEEIALEHEIFPADLHGSKVLLLNLPEERPAELEAQEGEGEDARLLQWASEQVEWRPVLIIGDEQVSQKWFTIDGTLKSEPAGNAGAAAGVGGAAGGMFGGFGGALGGAPPAPSSYLTAQWIEFELKTPGREARTHRRQLFDRVGPAARETGEIADLEGVLAEAGIPYLVATTEILALGFQPDPAFPTWLAARSFLANRPLLLSLARGEDGAGEVEPLPTMLYGLALATAALTPADSLIYHDQLSVYLYHDITVVGEAGLASTLGVDVVADGVTSLAGAPEILLERGVALTNAEAILQEEGPDSDVLHNTALLMEAGRQEGLEWVTLRNSAELDAASLKLSPDMAARLRQDLSDGFLVVAPTSPLTLAHGAEASWGWWRISPESGAALGMGALGWGQAMIEYDELVKEIVVGTACYISGGATAKNKSAVQATGELLMCVVGTNLRTAGWIGYTRAGKMGNIVSTITGLFSIATVIADSNQR